MMSKTAKIAQIVNCITSKQAAYVSQDYNEHGTRLP